MAKDDRPVMVSICCATYNHEKYIEQALKGFVSQITDFRYEIIVHEDASTDRTKSIIQKYVDMYPDLFVPVYQEENQYSKGRGIVPRNMFLLAKGKYIAMCEGDDYWCDEYKLQKQYDAMEKNPNCSICVHRIEHIYENRDIIEKPNARAKGIRNGYRFQSEIIGKSRMAKAIWLEGGYPFHTSSYFLRREVLDARAKNEAEFLKKMNGDMATLRLSLMYGDFYRIDEIMSCRRRGINGSWSARWATYPIEKKLEHYFQLAEGERLFDEYSEYEFHEYIELHIFNLIAECCIYSTKGIREKLKQNPLSINIIHDKDTFLIYIRYLIMRLSPDLYKIMCGIQKKIFAGDK